MKILHIITSLKAGGAENSISSFLSYIKKNCKYDCYEHVVIYFYGGMYVQIIHDLGVRSIHVRGFFSCYDPLSICKLFMKIKREKPTVIHTALWSANILGRVLGTLLNIPVISDLHGMNSHEGKFRNILEQATSGLAKRNIAVSKSVANDYNNNIIKKIKNANKKIKIKNKLIIINNGIDIETLVKKAKNNPIYRNQIRLGKNAFVIGTIGRIEKIKGYDLLIYAFAALLKKISNDQLKKKSLQLCIVGDGSDRTKLEKLAKSLNISSQILFTGIRFDYYKFYPLFDCFVLSSYSEGMSIALLEAISFGLPIITTNRLIEHDVIKHKKHGFVITNRDAQNYASYLEKLYLDQPLCKTISKENKKLIHDYGLKKQVDSIYSIYHELSI